jgi:hypothetical protein
MGRNPLLWFVLALLVSVGVALDSGDVAARGKKSSKKKAEKAEEKVEEVKPVWPSPLDPGLFDQVFRELPFGKERPHVLEILRQRLEEQLRPVLRATLDPRERDTLKAKMVKTFDEIRDSYAVFDGSEKGYAVSVVAGEFLPYAEEAVVKYAYSDNAAYLFFSGDKLWKLFVCTETTRDFGSLLVTLSSHYGDPQEIVHEDEEKTIPVTAAWRDTTFELRAVRPEGIFVCSRLVWTFLPSVTEVEGRRANAQPPGEGEGSAESMLEKVLSDPGGEDPDVIDKIINRKKKDE